MNKDTKIKKVISKNDTNVNEEIMNNPELLASLQDEIGLKLKALKNYEKLPSSIKRRVRALKNLQLEEIKIEEDFFTQLSLLELAFSEKYHALNDRRKEITMGQREPNDQECEYESDDMDDLADKMNNISAGDENTEENNKSEHTEESENGIPDFWLTVLLNCEIIRETIQEHDIPVLKHLIDIKCVLKAGEEHGFILEFYFSPNEFFTDEKLTKEYFVQIKAPKQFPFNYEGPEIVRTQGCTIHWNPGKNKTIKLVKKVQKRAKKDSDKRTVTKVVKNDSFFNFFDPPTDSLEDDDDIASEVENTLESDFEVGQYIRERIIPRAVLYFTGEGIEEDFDMEDDEDDASDVDEEESDDHQRDEKNISNNEDVSKPECKQQ